MAKEETKAVVLGWIKEQVRGELEAFVTKELKPAFDAQCEKIIARLPKQSTMIAPGGERVKHRDAVAELFESEEVFVGPSGFKGLGSWLRTVAVDPGNERLMSAAKAGLSEQDPERGGYLVPTEYASKLITVGIESARIFPLCQSVRMTASEMKIPVAASLDESGGLLYGGISYVWTNELSPKTEKEFKLARVGLKANVAACLVRASNQVLEDSTPRAETVLNDLFGRAWGNTLDNSVIRGTGVGQPLGILNASSRYTVAKESGQAAATIVLKNVQKMWARLHPTAKESSALRWLINDECAEQITSLNLPVGTGGAPAFLISGDAVRPVPKTLFGVPIVWTSHCSALGTEGDIILADLNAWLLGMRRELTAAASIHLHFDTNETTFRFEARVDGMPILPSTIKSRTGFEQSAFVTLATRS
jgi:HK97 family phage major capsid protein